VGDAMDGHEDRSATSTLRMRWFLIRHPRILGIMLNAWGVLIGGLSVIACAVFFLNPDDTLNATSVSQHLGPWDDVWNVMYGVGGLLMVYGIVKPDRVADVIGLLLFAGAVLVNMLAVGIDFEGRALVVEASFLGCCLSALSRAVVLVVLADFPHATVDRGELPPPLVP
jgi:hypothetical protein